MIHNSRVQSAMASKTYEIDHVKVYISRMFRPFPCDFCQEKRFDPYPFLNRLVFIFIFFVLSTNTVFSLAMPAVPNEFIIEGVVREYAIVYSTLIDIQSEMILYRVTIRIKSSEGVARQGMDFLENKTGEVVEFYSKEKLSPTLFGKSVRIRVRYTGDEKGGMFWIKALEKVY